ncbi:MAG TPA: hypothetical protein VJB12_04335 [Candidatus Nanoarchaeia archaeon]|nr:hypothetical protein [Candidatus Nanoarchaeia archaeon]
MGKGGLNRRSSQEAYSSMDAKLTQQSEIVAQIRDTSAYPAPLGPIKKVRIR